MKREYIFLGVFALVIIGVQGAFWFIPHDKVSEKEKRVLSEPPQVSLAHIADGRFMKKAETYVTDHFPARETFIGAQAYLRQAEGLNAANEIYRGKEGWLIVSPLKDEQTILKRNLSVLSEFLKRTGKPATALIVPTTGAVESDFLPWLHETYPDRSLLEVIQKTLNHAANWCDVLGAFESDPEREKLFYRTDHHWTTQGAYCAYRLFCAETARTPMPKTTYEITEVPDFYGTSYAKSGLWATKSDTLEVWQSETPVSVTVQDENMKQPKKQDSLFFWEHQNESDKYPIFLDGNHGRVTIETGSKGGRLLVLRDSFAHCLAPFLAEHFSRIDLIDLRYFKSQTVSEYLAENPADEILLCYGLDGLMTDRSIAQLQ